MVETDADKVANLVQGLRDDFKELKKSAQAISPTGSGASSNINFNVNAGSMGLRIAVTLCIVMFVLMVCSIGFSIYAANQQNAAIRRVRESMSTNLSKIEEKNNRMQDYLNIILQWSPELRKQVHEEDKKK